MRHPPGATYDPRLELGTSDTAKQSELAPSEIAQGCHALLGEVAEHFDPF